MAKTVSSIYDRQVGTAIHDFWFIYKMIESNIHFSFPRWGDGEFNAIFGIQGENCDGHPYYPEMGEELEEIFISHPREMFFKGCMRAGKLMDRFEKWVDGWDLHGQRFLANATFHDAYKLGHLEQLFNLLRVKDVVVVAPEYVRPGAEMIGADFIPIPGKETYEHLDSICIDLSGEDFYKKVVLVCASMSAPIIINYLYIQYLRGAPVATFIDFGSSFDPFIGKKSRSYHK